MSFAENLGNIKEQHGEQINEQVDNLQGQHGDKLGQHQDHVDQGVDGVQEKFLGNSGQDQQQDQK